MIGASLRATRRGTLLARIFVIACYEMVWPRARCGGKAPVKDHAALGRVLGALGALRPSVNLNKLAKALNTGSLTFTPETKDDLRQACKDVHRPRCRCQRARQIGPGQGAGTLRHIHLRLVMGGEVVQPLHWRQWGSGAERRPHRAAPDLQGWIDRPGRDPTDEDGRRMGIRCRGLPAARETELGGAADLVGLRRFDRPDEARSGDGRGRRRGSDPVLHGAYSDHNGASIQNHSTDSKEISPYGRGRSNNLAFSAHGRQGE